MKKILRAIQYAYDMAVAYCSAIIKEDEKDDFYGPTVDEHGDY